ncbi:leucine zipper transcription factor-like protein 1 isoform X1 [Dendronephthya gigantea]|uniref:leucine zipper transcription factor-like protein 1 isoform X1 n=1 Tax=Dendronephthya gigantea TaxID=151771 RepID=UPI00106BA5F3|nr:leucine zipper transcription factor-like protein 1 isoform X1 [Dendronephthya gigantea]
MMNPINNNITKELTLPIPGDIGINEHHQETIINYLRFARYNRGQCLRSVDACFEEYKDGRLVEDTYTLEEVLEMLHSLQSVVKGEVESELINTAHTNVLLLRQLFSQSEKWYLNLQADISELENRELIEEIAKFEEREFSAKKTVSQTSVSSKLAQKPKLEPLSDGSGSTLLQMEINRLQEENARLKEKIKMSESMAACVLDERSKLKADLEKTQSQLSTMSQSGDGEEIKELERRMQTVTMEMENVRKASSTGGGKVAEIGEQLSNAKHEILRLQHDLQEKEKELTKKFNETTQYTNMKQMLQTKNEQMKKLRQRLKKYEPNFES